MEYLKIRNWDRWQSYRRDQKSRPPWIKLYTQLLHDVEWIGLTAAQRGELLSIWLLAAQHDGRVPSSAARVRQQCGLRTAPDLQFFIDQGFIEKSVTDMDQTCSHRGEGEESRVDKEGEGNASPARSLDPIAAVARDLNHSSPYPTRRNGHDQRDFDTIKMLVLENSQRFKSTDPDLLHKLCGQSCRLSKKQIGTAITQLKAERRL